MLAIALAVGAVASPAPGAAAAVGPGGWDSLPAGATPGTPALNGRVLALNADDPFQLLVGGAFTEAGGQPGADHVVLYASSEWVHLGPGLTGDVNAVANYPGKFFAGGTFKDAGGNPNADFLAVWDGSSWAPACNGPNGPAFGGNVNALQIIGSTLYVGGSFQNGAGIASADYLLACDINTGAASSLVTSDGQISGGVYTLAADSDGKLYAGGTFVDMATIPEADYVAYYDGANWHALGGNAGTSAVTGIVRSLATSGTDAYVGTDGTDIASIPQADHVAKWDGSTWSAMGSNTAGTDGWFPPTTYIYGITASGSSVFVTGSFQNANGEPTADEIAGFDGGGWHPLGSNGAGNGPLNAQGNALAIFEGRLIAGGLFSNAGGNPDADSIAAYPLTAAPTPLPPPTEGKTVNAVPVSGKVLVKPASGAGAKAGGFVPLASVGRQVPVGSTFDTSKGVVRLVAATNSTGATQEGRISKGQFTVLQARKNPLTTLSMTGSKLGACSKLPSGGSPKAGASVAAKRKRTLFANVKGRFRTRGRNSSATVRGTQYRMTDTCAGTLTQVKKGTVTVRDFTLRKNRTVKAGRSYFARAPKRR